MIVLFAYAGKKGSTRELVEAAASTGSRSRGCL